MKRALLLVVACACVPATDEREPKGAAGFVTVPSPASRREPFTTTDGWNVRVETLAMNATVYAYEQVTSGYSGGGGDAYLFDGRVATEIFAPALSPGRYRVTAQLSYAYVYNGRVSGRFENFGVDEDVARRMTTPVAGVTVDAYGSEYAPSVVVVASGEKLGRVVRLDAGLPTRYAGGYGSDQGPTVEVRANVVATLGLGVHAEALFDRDGALVFDEIADADKNGDGRVTESELAATPADCPRCRTVSASSTLFEVLRLRGQSVLRSQ